jgi:hypothetical protein
MRSARTWPSGAESLTAYGSPLPTRTILAPSESVRIEQKEHIMPRRREVARGRRRDGEAAGAAAEGQRHETLVLVDEARPRVIFGGCEKS